MSEQVGADRVGVKFAPFYVLGASDSHKYGLFTYVLEELNPLGLAYVHMVEPRKGTSWQRMSVIMLHGFSDSG